MPRVFNERGRHGRGGETRTRGYYREDPTFLTTYHIGFAIDYYGDCYETNVLQVFSAVKSLFLNISFKKLSSPEFPKPLDNTGGILPFAPLVRPGHDPLLYTYFFKIILYV